jgi:hypothetical protein
LAQILNEKKCFVNKSEDFVGYIGPLRTMKYARRLMEKWHKKSVDGQKLKCQIEWNQRSLITKASSRSGSASNLVTNENHSRGFGRNHQAKNNSRNSSRDASPSRDDGESEITVVDANEINFEARLFNRSVENVAKQKEADTKRKTKSTENFPLSDDRKCTYIIIYFFLLYYIIVLAQSLNEISQCSRKMTQIKNEADGSSVFLIEYDDSEEEIYHRELNVLQLLKGKDTNEYKQIYIFFLCCRCERSYSTD